MSNWIELNKSNGKKVLVRANSINAIEETDTFGQDCVAVSGSGYSIKVKDGYWDILLLMAKQGELLIK